MLAIELLPSLLLPCGGVRTRELSVHPTPQANAWFGPSAPGEASLSGGKYTPPSLPFLASLVVDVLGGSRAFAYLELVPGPSVTAMAAVQYRTWALYSHTASSRKHCPQCHNANFSTTRNVPGAELS